MRFCLLPVLMLSASCAVTVYHPEKSEAEMQADIKRCTDEANRKYMLDPVAALYHAYDCMEAMGYTREQPQIASGVESAIEEHARETQRPKQTPSEPPKKQPVLPCRVPCKPK